MEKSKTVQDSNEFALFDIKKYHIVIEQLTEDGIRQNKRPLDSEERKWNGTTYPDAGQLKWAVEKAQYYDEKIGFYQPATQIRKALIIAGARRKIPGEDGRRTFAGLIGSSIQAEPAKLKHLNQKKEDISAVVFPTVRKTKGEEHQIYCVVRELRNWKLEFDIVNTQPDVLRDDYLKTFLDYAGLYCGLGVGRPARGGHFGRFKVISFKVIK